MKKHILHLITFFLLAGFLFADEGGYHITHFDFYGYLSRDKVLSVEETIDVEFTEERHGIYRTLPGYFYAERFNGKAVTNMAYHQDYEGVWVYDDEFSLEGDSSSLKIRIGDEDKKITGAHTYTITYDCVMYDDRIDLSDFFYYSPLGKEWNVPVDEFDFAIEFEEPFPDDTVFELYSGPYGSKENDLNVEYEYDSGGIYGYASNIEPNSAVTVFCELPEGYFEGAKKVNPAISIVFAVLAVICGLAAVYFIFASNTERPVPTVEFYPPKGVSAAEVGFIIDNSADDKDLFALYIEWAQKGYIKISENQKKKLILTKVTDLPKEAPKYQKTMFKATFAKGNTFKMDTVSSAFVKKLETAEEELEKEFTEDRALYERELLSMGFLWGMSILVGLSLLFSSPVYFNDNTYLVFVLIPFVFMGHIMNNSSYTRYFRRAKEILKYVAWFACTLILVPLVYRLIVSENVLPVPLIIVMFALFIIVCLFNGRIVKRTDYNLEVTGKLLGLRDFIKTAEMPRLEVLLKDNPGYYFDVFPYAVVFGLADKWAKQFTEIKMPQPEWYSGSAFTYAAFASSYSKGTGKIQDSVSASRSAARSAGSGSSGGHGGFSGGGGGGGGGGSW